MTALPKNAVCGFALAEDAERLSELWKLCFGDSEELVSDFLGKLFKPACAPVVRVDGDVVSMLFLLPGEFVISGKPHRSMCVYAACTHPDFRGLGLMSALMDFAASQADCDYLVLVPASDGLYDYYSKLGFLPVFSSKKLSLDRHILSVIAGNTDICDFREASLLLRLRREEFFGNCFIWDESVSEYILSENRLSDGKAVFFGEKGDVSGCALMYIDGKKAEVYELCAPNGFAPAAAALLAACHAEEFEITLPLAFPLSADSFTVYRCGMAKPLNTDAALDLARVRDAYFAITLE